MTSAVSPSEVEAALSAVAAEQTQDDRKKAERSLPEPGPNVSMKPRALKKSFGSQRNEAQESPGALPQEITHAGGKTVSKHYVSYA